MSPAFENLIADTIALTAAVPPRLAGEDAPVLEERSLSDEPMYLIGLIGGKEVGKSSLINALVGQNISRQTSHGPGTETVIAYAHTSAEAALRVLLEREVPGRYSIRTHDNAGLSRQVLVDLPDIDSIYAEHIDLTRRMLRQMLFPIWIQSIEKYADQQPQKLLQRVAEGNDPSNFIFCLNKTDQLVAREGEAAAGQLRDDYAARLHRLLNLPSTPAVYMISAQAPERFDFAPLWKLLSQQKTEQVVRQSQQLAGQQQTRTLVNWLDDQQLTARAGRAARLREEADEAVAARLGVPLLEGALPHLVADPAYRLSMIDPVLTASMARWPIVNVIHGLLIPVLAVIRKNVGASVGDQVNVNDFLTVEGQSLATLVQTTFAQLQQSNSTVGTLYQQNRLWESMPAEQASLNLRRRLTETLARQREAALARIARRRGIFMPLVRVLLTVGALLWFPIVQPILEVVLQGSITRFSNELLLKIVELLGTTFLLKNLTFLLMYFAVLWAMIRAGTVRRVNRLLLRWQNQADLDPSLSFNAQTVEWMDELLAPVQQHQATIDGLIERVETLRAQLPAPKRPQAA